MQRIKGSLLSTLSTLHFCKIAANSSLWSIENRLRRTFLIYCWSRGKSVTLSICSILPLFRINNLYHFFGFVILSNLFDPFYCTGFSTLIGSRTLAGILMRRVLKFMPCTLKPIVNEGVIGYFPIRICTKMLIPLRLGGRGLH